MAGPSGSLLFQDCPHTVDIYLPAAPTLDDGGAVKLNWSLGQSGVPCSINQSGGGSTPRQQRSGNTIRGRVAFLSSALTVTIVVGTKFVTTVQDAGRTLIVSGFSSPNRAYGNYEQDIPAFTYCDYEEYR